MVQFLKDKTLDVIKAVGPLVVVVIILQITVVKAPVQLFIQFVISAVMIIAGIVLFLLGIQLGVLPMGELIGMELPKRQSLLLIVAVAFSIGFATTIAEPDVTVLTGQVDAMSGGTVSQPVLIYVIGIGLALFTALAMLRIIYGIRIAYLLAGSYLTVIVLSFFTPPEFVSVAFDSGSATTGALTTPIVIALGLGFSSVLAGRSAISDGFGLIGLASVGPIIAVLIMGIILT